MIRIQLVCVGKSKFAWVHDGLNHYRKLLAPFIDFSVIETKAVPGDLSPAEIMAREAALLLDKIPKHSDLVCLDREGREMNSEDFAALLSGIMETGRDIAIIVGGPYGIDPELRRQAQQCLSLSKLTFPHDLVRLVCAEQLYRAISIQRGHPYHK